VNGTSSDELTDPVIFADVDVLAKETPEKNLNLSRHLPAITRIAHGMYN